MSAAALQRVVVRLLHDPALVAALPHHPIPGAELTAQELAWLRAVDPRRWRVDPLRRYRSLQAALEECPAAGALAIRQRGVPGVDAFFSAPAFHTAIQTRQALAPSFGAWLADAFGGAVAAMAHLELAIGRVRRSASGGSTMPTDGRLALAPGWAPVAPPAGTLAAWQALIARLDAHGGGRLAAVVDGAWRLPSVRLGPEPEGLLVEAGPAIGEAALPLVRFLEALADPRTPAQALALLAELGAEGEEAADLLAELQADGLVWGGQVGQREG